MKVVRLEHSSISKRGGRPPSFEFTREMADRICELMINGEDLGTICRRGDMPNRVCADRWRVQHPDFHDQFARARECLAHVEFDKIKELIENCTEENANSTRVKINA